MSFRRLRAVARKEFIHVFRDWRSLALAVAIPALLILIFGYALDMDLNKVPTIVWDQSRTPESRIHRAFQRLALFFHHPYADGYGDMQRRLENGDALLGFVVPADFVQRLRQGRAQAQVIADGSDANTARLALGYASRLGRPL